LKIISEKQLLVVVNFDFILAAKISIYNQKAKKTFNINMINEGFF